MVKVGKKQERKGGKEGRGRTKPRVKVGRSEESEGKERKEVRKEAR
jgi:hypothetical protein